MPVKSKGIDNITLPVYKELMKAKVGRFEVSNISQLTDAEINQLKCGDIVNKKDASGLHAYVVSYKKEGTGICLTYCDGSGYIETVSYDYTEGHWVYNSTDVFRGEQNINIEDLPKVYMNEELTIAQFREINGKAVYDLDREVVFYPDDSYDVDSTWISYNYSDKYIEVVKFRISDDTITYTTETHNLGTKLYLHTVVFGDSNNNSIYYSVLRIITTSPTSLVGQYVANVISSNNVISVFSDSMEENTEGAKFSYLSFNQRAQMLVYSWDSENIAYIEPDTIIADNVTPL